MRIPDHTISDSKTPGNGVWLHFCSVSHSVSYERILMKFYNRVVNGTKTKNSDFGGNSVLDPDHRHSCSTSGTGFLVDICYYDFF